MRNGYIFNVLTSVGIEAIFRKSSKVIEFHEDVICTKNFEKNTFKKLLENLFAP